MASLRYPVLEHCLGFCKSVRPDLFAGVIDIGVKDGTDFLITVFPAAHHHLFEPVVSTHETIRSKYTSLGIPHTLYPVALTNVSTQLYLHQLSSDGSGSITHSEVSDSPTSKSTNLHSIEPVQGQRLDDVEFDDVGKLEPLKYLTKLDVDGVEELIVEGGQEIIANSSFVVMEASVVRDNVLGRLQLMEDLGFRLFDICDNAYYYNQLSCLDLVFINNKVRADEIMFRPWEYAKHKVHWQKWQQGYPELAKQEMPKVY